MIEYEVEIKTRPLGVRFAHADRGETVVVHLVLENKLGHKLGLLPGDILISVNGKSVLEKPSNEALDLFRNQELPFKAAFRRFEDDDDFDSEDDSDEESEHTQFMKEDISHLMHALSLASVQANSNTIDSWSVNEVLVWLGNYGRSLGDENKFLGKYKNIFIQNKIDGKTLKGLDKIDLGKMGISEKDCHELHLGILHLKSIVYNAQSNLQKQLANKNGNNNQNNGNNNNNNNHNNPNNNNQNGNNNNNNNNQSSNNEDEDDDEDDEDDDDEKKNEDEPEWEAPFLPYMYDAPNVQLSGSTKVDVYSARVVAPIKKTPFALYEIEVIDGDNEWLLSKRYSEFFRLYSDMKKLGIHTKTKFPKKGFNKSTDKSVIEDRKKKLTDYLNELLKEYPKARASKELNEFLSPSRTFVVDE